MLMLIGIYVLNTLSILFVSYWNGIKEFYEMGTPYIASLYLLYIYIPICIYSIYRKVFNTNYFIVSRYPQKKRFIAERYIFIVQQNVVNAIFLVCLPLIVGLLVYQMYSLSAILFIVHLTLRYFLMAVVMCSLYFTLFLTFPILQIKLQIMLMVFLPVLPLLQLVKEILKPIVSTSWLYYLNFEITLPESNDVFTNLVVSNAPLLAYYFFTIVIRFFILEKVELFQHENYF